LQQTGYFTGIFDNLADPFDSTAQLAVIAPMKTSKFPKLTNRETKSQWRGSRMAIRDFLVAEFATATPQHQANSARFAPTLAVRGSAVMERRRRYRQIAGTSPMVVPAPRIAQAPRA
jgi:hypothetical protein